MRRLPLDRAVPRAAAPARSAGPARLAAAAALLALGCQSTPAAPAVEPYHGALVDERSETSVGFFISEIDAPQRAWSNYKLTSTSRRDERTLRMLEQELRLKTYARFDDLLRQLESGPPKNRAVAAMAIGFTGREEALSPLLAALDEEDPGLVGNALIALGLLAHPDTPLAQVCHLLTYHLDAFTRSNAAFCLQRLTSAGIEDECVVASCRDALLDEEPAVRAQAATLLGTLEDSASAPDVTLLLDDDEPLVLAAAARSLVMLGRADPHVKGAAGRALVSALDRLPRRLRGHFFQELARLAERSYGEDEEAWKDWAFRLD